MIIMIIEKQMNIITQYSDYSAVLPQIMCKRPIGVEKGK